MVTAALISFIVLLLAWILAPERRVASSRSLTEATSQPEAQLDAEAIALAA